ncbi:MAG: murein hydrolase activator EnvC [Gammaproteobacteria bacterium]
MRWSRSIARRKMPPERGRHSATQPTPAGRVRRRAAVTLLAALLANGTSSSATDLEQVRARIGEVRAALADDADRLTAAREAAFALDRDIAEATARQQTLDARIKAKLARVDELERAHEHLATGVSDAQALLQRNLIARYALSMQPRLKLLLNQGQARAVSRQLAYHDYIARAYGHDVGDLDAKLAQHAAAAAALRLETATLRRLRQQAADEIARLAGLREERAALITDIETGLADDQARLAQLENDERELLALMERLERAPVTAPAAVRFAELEGKLAWPVDGRVAKAPGQAHREGGARWAGVVIAADGGSAVHAVAAGEVVYADWFRNLGRLVIIDHDDGYMSLYGNTAGIVVAPGTRVAAGDTIAAVGDGASGSAQGLYFELRAAGRPLDPRTWCARR